MIRQGCEACNRVIARLSYSSEFEIWDDKEAKKMMGSWSMKPEWKYEEGAFQDPVSEVWFHSKECFEKWSARDYVKDAKQRVEEDLKSIDVAIAQFIPAKIKDKKYDFALRNCHYTLAVELKRLYTDTGGMPVYSAKAIRERVSKVFETMKTLRKDHGAKCDEDEIYSYNDDGIVTDKRQVQFLQHRWYKDKRSG